MHRHSGQKYSELKRVIGVLIIDYEMYPEDSLLHHCFRFVDRKAELEFSDMMEVHVLELPKAREKATIDSPPDVWLKFFAASTKEECMQYAAPDRGVKEACVVLKDMSRDERIRMEAEDRMKAWRDEMDRLDGAKEQGILIGKELGSDIGKKNIARKILEAGEPVEIIAAYTDLSVESICRLSA